mgnify:CR=1 FL=1
MKKQISLRMWLSVFWGGIWQFIKIIFSRKNKTLFFRVIWCVISFCMVAFTCMLGYAFYDEFYGRSQRCRHYSSSSDLGSDFYFYNDGPGKSYIADRDTKKKIHKGLDWIARPEDGDSLVVFAKDGKRGFLSCRTANIVIPAKYDAAWCFNDGVAGVCEGDSVFFIDHSGKPIYSRKFKREKGHNYTYHGNFFVNQDGDKFGLVDRQGNDATLPIYENLFAVANNMWVMKYKGKMGAINDKGSIIIPNEYAWVEIYPEGGIVVMSEDNSKKRLDYEGNVANEFVYDFTYTLEYYSDDLDKEGNRVKKPANVWHYSCNGHYGLIDKNGRPITAPIYSSIEALSADLYECQIDDGGERLIINSKGEEVN